MLSLVPRRSAGLGDDGAATDLLRLRLAAGAPPADMPGISDRCRRAVAVATAVGAPMLDAVDAAAAAEDDLRRARRAVAVASAQTRAVAAGLLAAPLLLVPGLGRLVGADLVGFYTTGIGALVLVAGVLLLAVGAAIVVLLVKRVGRRPRHDARSGGLAIGGTLVAGWLAWRVAGPALVPLAAVLGHQVVSRRRRSPPSPEALDEAADLVATAVAGGISVTEALRVAADHRPDLAGPLLRLAFELELGLDPTEGPDADLARIRAVLVTATEVGAPVAPTLRRLASDLRADDLSNVLAATERLPAQLTFPTALCLLPATVLLVGAPIVHAGLVTAGT